MLCPKLMHMSGQLFSRKNRDLLYLTGIPVMYGLFDAPRGIIDCSLIKIRLLLLVILPDNALDLIRFALSGHIDRICCVDNDHIFQSIGNHQLMRRFIHH